MRICYICDGYPPAQRVGGIEVFTQTLARGLVSRGHQASVVGFSNGYSTPAIEDDQGVRVVRLPAIGKSRARGLPVLQHYVHLEWAIRQEVRQSRCELVECPDVRGSLILGKFGTPVVVRMHGAHFVYSLATQRKPQRFTPFFEKRTLHLATHLVAVSRYIRDATLSAAGLVGRPCEVVYNGVDTSLFRPAPDVRRESQRILFVGRLTETKGAPQLFKALPTVFHQQPGAHLRFVGRDPVESDGRRASDRLIGELPEQDRASVVVAGEKLHEELPPEFQKASVVVFPSQVEAHPIAVIEAMACGCPVVFMAHGPGPEMVTHGEDGLLCDTGSPAAIAEAIISLLADPERARRLGERAAARVAREHSLNVFITQNERFYQSCLDDWMRGKKH